ncbi:hypothetical protein PT974_06164 [Cladobotryum mycophilum]|uniref:Uncharacterized protein n=1 Tax=Cladobotryum mycophilum TaxID=491253 RepID=A0ABR0SKS8_9HYPO
MVGKLEQLVTHEPSPALLRYVTIACPLSCLLVRGMLWHTRSVKDCLLPTHCVLRLWLVYDSALPHPNAAVPAAPILAVFGIKDSRPGRFPCCRPSLLSFTYIALHQSTLEGDTIDAWRSFLQVFSNFDQLMASSWSKLPPTTTFALESA